eukprot:scaffold3079_cov174-Amphora_coffeaeformis.AAC.9
MEYVNTVVIFSLLLLLLEEDQYEDRNARTRKRWALMSEKRGTKEFKASHALRFVVLLLAHGQKEFAPWFYSYTPYSNDGRIRKLNPSKRRGRRHVIRSETCLAVVLLWCRTTCQYWVLSTSFGLVGTSCGDWLRFGKRVIVHVLSKREDSVVRLPSAEKVSRYKEAIERKYPVLKDVAFVGDGLNILLQKAGDQTMQEVFYNGWKSGYFITNMFVFAPDGTVVMSMLNCPGTMHDS